MIITIDGPSGSGKSTVARKLAKKLGFIHVNQGAFYRAVGLRARALGIALDDDAALARLVSETDFEMVPLSDNPAGDSPTGLLVDGVDMSDELLSNEAGLLASTIAVLPSLREAILAAQRAAVENRSVVVEGRDAGSVGFPDAELKVYLDARLAVRAKRRFEELQERGKLGGQTLEGLQEEMEERDSRDRNRELAPLAVPEGAVRIDTSDSEVDEVVAMISTAAETFINN